RQLLGKYADSLGPFDKNAVTVQQPAHIGVRLGEVLDEVAHLADEIVIHVIQQSADARVARVETLARNCLENVIKEFTLVEAVQKRGKGAQVEGGGAGAQQMIAD